MSLHSTTQATHHIHDQTIDNPHDNHSASGGLYVVEPEPIEELARQLSKTSVLPTNPFLGSDDPRLIPDSGVFDHQLWIRTILDVQSRDPERFPARTAGISFQNLGAYGFSTSTNTQRTVTSVVSELFSYSRRVMSRERKRKTQILRNFDGLVKSGEMLLVLGRPGSGCTTLLKSLAGETHGFSLDAHTDLHYQGIPRDLMMGQFRGEVIYQAEADYHFPQLTVGESLSFAARARAPQNRIEGISREQWADHMRDVTMTVLGLLHTVDTPVGNEIVRGVSGGERKRVSIAEAILSGAPIQCWDNSTRGLDSATALTFVKTLKAGADASGCTAVVAIYQASQNAYDLFDKVTLLYEGHQIYFGRTQDAKNFFIQLGYDCPPRQTTADFLTSLTNPSERTVRPGFEHCAPRTADEFAAVWRSSEEYKRLISSIKDYAALYPIGGEHLVKFKHSRRLQQARNASTTSPFTLSVPMQIWLCLSRAFQRLRNDTSLFFTMVIGNAIVVIIIATVFINIPQNTGSFFSRSALLFYAIVMNAFASALEILTLYVQRPIIEKQASQYAFYHPYAEAIASVISELPAKLITAITTNVIIYFVTNLRREPGAFFIFFLVSFTITMVMSMIFRTIGAATKTIHQAMTPAALMTVALITYTGFIIPIRDMKPWFRWINYLNPIAYGFEALMVNEFDGRDFPCSNLIPSYPNVTQTLQFICNTPGSVPGQDFVRGGDWLRESYDYHGSHLWRNYGILLGFMLFFLGTYLCATEFMSSAKSRGEILVFKRGHSPVEGKRVDDEEAAAAETAQRVQGVTGSVDRIKAGIVMDKHEKRDIFMWRDVCYDIKLKKETRRLLDHIDGWVMPGTLTALMGVSGAGKTTLLDVLARRTTLGNVTGDMFVNGRRRDVSFQRKTGYVQQQDLHLQTSTVREALVFSAFLRQPNYISREKKRAHVEEVINLLDMEDYAEAVVGVLGEGLNIEQRKRLTIAVELAAKPQLLLFLDEPTSGLDSQTAWSICSLLKKLANNGQAILCTIHQPSAILFQEFDRLLFLAPGGKTVYFGDIGQNSRVLTGYFENNGAEPCPHDANPAEWMMDVVNNALPTEPYKSWPEVWNGSSERETVRQELARMQQDLGARELALREEQLRGFAAPFSQQLYLVYERVMQQYWRTPSYIWSKLILVTLTSLFVGFSFYKANNTLRGMQNQILSLFMFMTIFNNLVGQILPHFVAQRSLYEARERPAKIYSWQSFMLANMAAEIPWQTLASVLAFVSLYYPVGFMRNAEWTNSVVERGGLFFLVIWAFFMLNSTFAHMVIAGVESAEAGGNLSNLMFTLAVLLCGVLAVPNNFWIFVYRASPFTYIVSALLSTGLARAPAYCSSIELQIFDPPPSQTCGSYLAAFMSTQGGSLFNADSTSGCRFCPVSSTDEFLETVRADYDTRWRDFGLIMLYVVFNVFAALGMYWLARVPKRKKVEVGELSIAPDHSDPAVPKEHKE